MELSLKMLGGFAVRDGTETELSLRTRKTRALLAYLAVNADKPQPRERLMALLWSDRSEQQARQSLNQALVSIRHLADGGAAPLIESDRVQVTLRGEVLRSDVAQFRSAIASDPATAAAIYDGLFLDGMAAPDPAFEEWLRTTRAELQGLACMALESAAEAAEDKGDLTEATNSARRQIALDPLNEDAHRRLMRLLHRAGDRAAALRQFEACAGILRNELDVEPDGATNALMREIKGDTAGNFTQANASSDMATSSAKSGPQPPTKPSIAVLPFECLYTKAQEDTLGDGIAEDIITGLSRFRWLLVIARRSTVVYKGKSSAARDIARELGVRYILEGTVRRNEDQIRISAQLIDALAGNQIWAEQYDRNLQDIFKVQDEIRNAIVAAIAPEIDHAERLRAQRKPPENLNAWDLYQRGLAAFDIGTKEALSYAIDIFDKVIALDPQFAPGYSMANAARVRFVMNSQPEDRSSYIKAARFLAEKAMSLDPRDPLSQIAAGRGQFLDGEYELAIAKYKEAIHLNPNFATAHYVLGFVLRNIGKAEEALSHLETAMRLSPHDPDITLFQQIRAHCLFDLERYEEAEEWVRKAILSPNVRVFAYVVMIATLVQLDRKEEAKSYLNDLYEFNRDFSLDFIRKATARHQNREKQIARVLAALRAVGVPEHPASRQN
jgi:TolB-like protein/Tfp pilus assembly protein PilF